jgi:hypothetical protein
MMELQFIIFLIFVAVATTFSYAFGFNRGEEFATNFLIDDMIDKGILEVVEEDEQRSK